LGLNLKIPKKSKFIGLRLQALVLRILKEKDKLIKNSNIFN
jgi:hypothetical protein